MSAVPFTVSDFYCLKCGRKGVPIARRKDSQRELQHLKNIYCVFCQEEYNHLEKRPFSASLEQDFLNDLSVAMLVEKLYEIHFKKQLENIPTLFVMVGGQGAGKSHISKLLQERSNQEIKWICEDKIKIENFKKNQNTSESETFKDFIFNLKNPLKQNVSVIADTQNLTQEKRRELIKALEEYGDRAYVVVVLVDTMLKKHEYRHHDNSVSSKNSEQNIENEFIEPNLEKEEYINEIIISSEVNPIQ